MSLEGQIDYVFNPSRECKLCGKQTHGSVGAAGYKWRSLCQPCKDREDGAALDNLRTTAAVFNALPFLGRS
jgi:hypothetical protein